MTKDEIEVDGEYAVTWNRYQGRLAHVRVVSKDHPYEKTVGGSYSTRTEPAKGYLVELVEPYESRVSGRPEEIPVGEQRVIETGRDFLHTWDAYAKLRVEEDAKKEERTRAAEQANEAYRRVGDALLAAGLREDDEIENPADFFPRTTGWNTPPAGVILTLEAAERLLGLIPRRRDGKVVVSLPVTNGQRAGLEVEEEPGQYVVRLLLDPPPRNLHREVYATVIPKGANRG